MVPLQQSTIRPKGTRHPHPHPIPHPNQGRERTLTRSGSTSFGIRDRSLSTSVRSPSSHSSTTSNKITAIQHTFEHLHFRRFVQRKSCPNLPSFNSRSRVIISSALLNPGSKVRKSLRQYSTLNSQPRTSQRIHHLAG
jgi:hypothetical protein